MARRGSSTALEQVTPDWRELLGSLPGYDPFRDAAGCRFDAAAARLALDFFPACLKHVEGAVAGQPFRLERWQEAVVANLFGWTRAGGARRYREVLLYLPRKNGKTVIAAGIALYVFFCDEEAGQQDYIAAGDREQAALLFRHCRGMVEQEPQLDRRCRIYGGAGAAGQSRSIVRERDASFLRVVSADAETKHGGNTHLAIVDELHVQPNRDLVDAFLTSMASENRRQPLLIYITTADFDRESICNEVHGYAGRVRDGILRDPSFLPVIYEADREAAWTDPAVWAAVNPNLGVSVSREYLERECRRAQELPAYENTFRRLHLNQRTEADVRAIPMDRWDASAGVVDAEALKGRPCYGGLDLATTTDLAAFVLVFPGEGGAYQVLPFFWVPREGARARERRDRVPYETWIRQGLIRATEGDVIDYDVIRRDINALGERYEIVEIAADRWNSLQLLTQLTGDGFGVIGFGQGFKDMTSPTKELLKLVIEGKLHHGGHAVLRWNASNLATETDAAGNLKPSKKKSTEKIDGLVGTVMGLGRALLRDADAWYVPGCLTS